MDVQRYLNDEPVVARPPSRLYRFQKLVRRNKTVFAAGAVVAVTLIVGLGTSTWLFFRERDARHEQARLREQAQQAERRESELRQQAEEREKITQAAVFVSQARYDDANRLLDEVKTPPPNPSFDGVAAYRQVGVWLATQERWHDAANRFYPLMVIDKLDDWRVVTLDYQSCGVLLAETGDGERYRHFCQAAITRFAAEIASTNVAASGDMAGRILKTCLLTPPDAKLLGQLQPLGEVSEKWFATLSPNLLGWAAIPTGLWNYRCGDFGKAMKSCLRGLDPNAKTSALDASLRFVLAMSDYQSGEMDEARSQLAQGRKMVDAKFQAGLAQGNGRDGFWYDWVFAQILLGEATTLIDGNPPASASSAPTRAH
jgi:hypothetical protein